MQHTKVDDTDKKKHVVIIGGGYIGVMQAYYLSKSFNVTVIEEQSNVSKATSFMNGGLLCPSLSYPWTNIGALKIFFNGFMNPSEDTIRISPRAMFDPLMWRWIGYFFINLPSNKVLQNYRDSYNLSSYSYKLMNEDLVPFNQYRRKAQGTLQLFASKEKRDATFKLMMDGIGVLGCEIQKLNYEDCLSLSPGLREGGGDGGGIYTPGDSSGDINLFTNIIKQKSENMGVKYVFNSSVKNLVLNKELRIVTGVQIDDGSIIHADEVIIAAGNSSEYFASQAGDQILSYPIKGYVFEIPLSNCVADFNVNISDDVAKIYVSPMGTKEGEDGQQVVRLSGLAEFKGKHDTDIVLADSLKLLHKALNFFVSDFLGVNYDGTIVDTGEIILTSCCRPQTPDDLPVIGKSLRYSNLWYNAGHGHIGWTRGAGSAKLLADLMTNAPTEIDPEPFKLERFSSLLYRKLKRDDQKK